MAVDLSLARAKLYAAIGEQAQGQRQAFTLRPSNIGQCPLRLQFEQQDSLAGAPLSGEREPRLVWSAYQGSVSEELITLLLEAAGAEIVQPPHDSDGWMDSVPPDPETGFKPHIDLLIRWPEIGLTEWAVGELKNLTASAHVSILFNGLYNERVYWFQAVSYLRIARLAMEQYAAWEIENGVEGPWQDLVAQKVVPQGIFWASVAKDPSMANANARQQTGFAKYELEEPKKGWKPEQLEMIARKKGNRERLELNDNDASFYFEYVDRSDPSVLETWDDITNIKRQVELSSRAEPLHNIAVPDDKLPTECKWYCQYLDRHRQMGLTLLEQLTVSVEQLRAQQQEDDTVA